MQWAREARAHCIHVSTREKYAVPSTGQAEGMSKGNNNDSGELAELYAGIGTLLSIAADAIIAIDADHKITLFNEGAERIFGYSKAEILGQPLSTLIPDRYRLLHTHHIAALQMGQKASRLMGERSGHDAQCGLAGGVRSTRGVSVRDSL